MAFENLNPQGNPKFEVVTPRLAERLTKGEGRAYTYYEPGVLSVGAGATGTLTITSPNNQREVLKAFTLAVSGGGTVADLAIRIRDSNNYLYTQSSLNTATNPAGFIDGDLVGDNNHPWRFVEGPMARMPPWKQLGAPIVVHPNQSIFVDVLNNAVGSRTVLLKFIGKRDSGLLPTMRSETNRYIDIVRSPNGGFYVPFFFMGKNTSIAAGANTVFNVNAASNEEIILTRASVSVSGGTEVTFNLTDGNQDALQDAALNFRVFGDNNHPTRFIEHPFKDDPREDAGAAIVIPGGSTFSFQANNPSGGGAANVRVLLQGKKEISRQNIGNYFSFMKRVNYRGGRYTPYFWNFDQTNGASASGTKILNVGSAQELLFHKVSAPLVSARAALTITDNLGQFYNSTTSTTSNAGIELLNMGDANHPDRLLDGSIRPSPDEENGDVLAFSQSSSMTAKITDTSGAGSHAIFCMYGKIERPGKPGRF